MCLRKRLCKACDNSGVAWIRVHRRLSRAARSDTHLSVLSILHASPMPDSNTISSVKPQGAHHLDPGDVIELYDRSFASSPSAVSLPPRRSRSTSTERLLRRAGFSAFYYNTVTQVCLLGLVCFMCPGSFNALNGLGAAGRVDSTVNSNSNSALYSTFAVAAFFSG